MAGKGVWSYDSTSGKRYLLELGNVHKAITALMNGLGCKFHRFLKSPTLCSTNQKVWILCLLIDGGGDEESSRRLG